MSVSPERIEEALAAWEEAKRSVRPERHRTAGDTLAAVLREAQAENERLQRKIDAEIPWTKDGAYEALQAENERLLERAEKAESEATDWQYACEESQASEADLMAEAKQMRERIRHVVNDSPGTPESVKQYLRAALAPADEAKR